MQIHIASPSAAYTGDNKIIADSKYILESYHFLKKKREDHYDVFRKYGHKVFLDSGAFSAFTQGVEIDLEAYVAYIRQYKDVIKYAAALDVIGNAEATLVNYERMLNMDTAGIPILPCYHHGEPPEFLHKMLETTDHLALGGLVGASRGVLMSWLDWIWGEFLTNPDGTPKAKVHGFGITDWVLMFRYPWFSVDSTSWVLTSRFGNVFLDLPGKTGAKISFSDKSPSLKDFDQHYDSMSTMYQEVIRKAVEAKGYTIDELRSVYQARDHMNVFWFNDHCDKEPVTFKRKELTFF